MKPSDLFYYVGEKPPPLPCRYEDEDGTLITSISGATLTAKCKVDENTEFDVTCTNSGTGEFTIDWDTATSSFAHAGMMKIDIEVAASPRLWFMPRFQIEILTR